MGMMKKQSVLAFLLLLLIPVVLMLGGMLSNLINPEIAAGHPNYARNYQLLNTLKIMIFLASAACGAVLWMLACLVVIRSKKRSYLWLLLAVLGPFGIAVLAMLRDRAPLETDRYARFVRNLNGYVRVGYEVCTFVIVWVVAYEAMVLQRTLMIRFEAATTGVSTAQIMNVQNASSGMWAFAEGNEVMFLVAVFYLLRPMVFSVVSGAMASMASRATPGSSNT
jgi:hypothetical protein